MSKPPFKRTRPAGPSASRTSSAAPRSSNIIRSNILAGRTRNGRINPVATLRNIMTMATLGTCPLKQECGACTYVNTDYDKSLAEKYNHGLAVLGKSSLTAGAQLLPPLGSPRQLGYRTLFKLAVRPAKPPTASVSTPAIVPGVEGEVPVPAPVISRFALGMFKPGTHTLGPDLGRCPIHAQSLSRLIRDLKTALDVSPLSPFSEETGKGDVRYVVARTSHLTGELMVTFVVTTPLRMELQRVVSKLKSQEHKIHASFMNIQSGDGNAIFGKETIHLSGSKGLRESLCDLDFEVGPTAFFQVNPWQASNLYRRVEQIVGSGNRPASMKSMGTKDNSGEGSVAWDLYCGIGQISLILAAWLQLEISIGLPMIRIGVIVAGRWVRCLDVVDFPGDVFRDPVWTRFGSLILGAKRASMARLAPPRGW